MPAVQFRATDHIVQQTVAQLDIGMLEKAVDGVEHEVHGDHRLAHPQQDERQGVEEHLQDLLQRMEAPDVQPVQAMR
jgi:hypothetical protein